MHLQREEDRSPGENQASEIYPCLRPLHREALRPGESSVDGGARGG